MNSLQCGNQIILGQAKTDSNKMIHTKMISGYNQYTFLLAQAVGKLTGVDIKIIARQIEKDDPGSRYEEIKEIYSYFKDRNAKISIRKGC